MLSGVEAGLNQAMERLPDNVAQKVKGNRFINRCAAAVQVVRVMARRMRHDQLVERREVCRDAGHGVVK